MKIVLDTNVLVSGLLSPFAPPGDIVRMVSAGELILCLDARLMAECREVLARPKFGFDPDSVAALLEYVEFRGQTAAGPPLRERLPDPDDEPFLEVALASGAAYLVTGNLAHFPEALRGNVRVVSPAEFLEAFRSGQLGAG